MRRVIYWDNGREHWYTRPVPDPVIEKIERREEDAVDGHGRVGTCKRKDGSDVGVGLPGPAVPGYSGQAGASAFLFRPSGRSRQPHPSSYRR